MTVQPNRFGSVEYVISRLEHPILPEPGWISSNLHRPEDVEKAIALLLENIRIVR